MQECIINSPLGFTKIIGDKRGIASITILNSNEKITDIIPQELEDCVDQLNAYFRGERQQFNLEINPQKLKFLIFLKYNLSYYLQNKHS